MFTHPFNNRLLFPILEILPSEVQISLMTAFPCSFLVIWFCSAGSDTLWTVEGIHWFRMHVSLECYRRGWSFGERLLGAGMTCGWGTSCDFQLFFSIVFLVSLHIQSTNCYLISSRNVMWSCCSCRLLIFDIVCWSTVPFCYLLQIWEVPPWLSSILVW